MRDWRMTFLPQFKMCVEAGSYSLMCSYNRSVVTFIIALKCQLLIYFSQINLNCHYVLSTCFRQAAVCLGLITLIIFYGFQKIVACAICE